MEETTMEQPVWPSKLDEGDLLFAIVDGGTSEVPFLVYSSMEKKASFVRDRGAWQKVGETFFEKLEDLPNHYVDDVTIDAIAIYDAADKAGKTATILDISNTSGLKNTSISQKSTVQEEVDGLLASVVIEEERDLAEALIEITKKHGKFNSDDMGVWAGYESAEENEHADIGVKCANCILYEGGTSCKIIAAEVEPGGYCRFALIPDGVVTASGNGPCWDGYKQVGMKKGKNGNMVPNCVPINASSNSEFQIGDGAETTCPPATTDIAVNLTNRKKAIRVANYGPLNPQEPNEEYWKERAAVWSVTPEEAQNSLCGNCAMFSITTKIRQCIADGISSGGSGKTDAWDVIDTAELGYCEAFDFKCAASRTCDAWVTGGPITDDSEGKEEVQ
jgi:hypothetical protein